MSENIVDPADVRVSDLAGHVDLPPEAPRDVAICVPLRSQGFDGNLRAEFLVLCLIYLAHAARPNQPNDVETAAQYLARMELRLSLSWTDSMKIMRGNGEKFDAGLGRVRQQSLDFGYDLAIGQGCQPLALPFRRSFGKLF